MDANPAFGVQSKEERMCEGEEQFLQEESWLLQALLFSKALQKSLFNSYLVLFSLLAILQLCSTVH